jgi:hypothetical protein
MRAAGLHCGDDARFASVIPGNGTAITIWTRTSFTERTVLPCLERRSGESAATAPEAIDLVEQRCIMTDEADPNQNKFAISSFFIFAATIVVLGAVLSFLQLPVFRSAAMALVMPLLMFGVPALIVWLAVVTMRLFAAIWRQRWRTAAAQALILLAVPPTTFAGLYIGPYVHFALSYPYYALQVRLSPGGGATPMRFSWGGARAVGSMQTDRWLVYDRPRRSHPTPSRPTPMMTCRARGMRPSA